MDFQSCSPDNSNQCFLQPTQAVAAACVLKEAIDQLVILGNINNLPKIEADLEIKTFEERFQNNTDNTLFDPETIEPCEKAAYKYKFKKFQLDRSYVEKVLRETFNSLGKQRCFLYLLEHLCLYNRKIEDENILLAKENKDKVHLKKIYDIIERERVQTNFQIQKKTEAIGNLKDEFEDIITENNIKFNYVETWEHSRTEQSLLFLNKKQKRYLNLIEAAKTNIDREMRINIEIEAFIRETRKEYENTIEEWMERYDNEIETRDTQIQALKAKREEQLHRLQNITLMYEDHKRQIEEYLAAKEKRKEEQEEEKRIERAVIKIQAWWRGVMVRKGFGRFRRKKDKKKGKK